MKKKLVAMTLMLALLAGGPWPALAAALPDSFVPEKLVKALNEALSLFAEDAFTNATDAERSQVLEYMRLSYTEESGGVVYYNNTDWALEVSGYYEGRSVNVNAQADTLSLTISESLGSNALYLMQASLVYAVRTYDETVDYTALLNWLDSTANSGEMFRLNGYVVLLLHQDQRYQYSLLPNDRVSGGDAPQHSDDIFKNNNSTSDDGAATSALPTQRPVGHFQKEDGGARQPEATAKADDCLLSWNGFSVKVLNIVPQAYSDGSVYVDFCARYINNTPYTIDMFLEDVTVDGVTIDGNGELKLAPGLDTGEASEEYFFIMPNRDNIAAGTQAICNGNSVSMTIRLVDDNNHYEELYKQRVTISLAQMPRFTPRATTAPTPTPKPTPTVFYPALTRGDSGEDVRRLQLRLIELGYLFDDPDGKFGSKTAAAVREFATANGLSASEIATPEMQVKLYSSGAKAYEEPYVTLIVTRPSSYGEWKKYNSNRIGMRVQVTNVSRTKTVKAFEMYMYAEDVYGDPIYGEGVHYYATTTKTVGPGKTVYCDYMVMPDRNRVSKIYAGVKKVVYTDGTVRENSTVNYYNWDIRW